MNDVDLSGYTQHSRQNKDKNLAVKNIHLNQDVVRDKNHGQFTRQLKTGLKQKNQAFKCPALEHWPRTMFNFDLSNAISLYKISFSPLFRFRTPVQSRIFLLYLSCRVPISSGLQYPAWMACRRTGEYMMSGLALAKNLAPKLAFEDIYGALKDPERAEMGIKKWLSWAVRPRLEPFRSFAKAVNNHFQGLMRYFKSGPTKGPVEGINSGIQEARRRAKGFRDTGKSISKLSISSPAGRPCGISLPARNSEAPFNYKGILKKQDAGQWRHKTVRLFREMLIRDGRVRRLLGEGPRP